MTQTNGQPKSKTSQRGRGTLQYPIQVQADYTLKQGRRILEKNRTHAIGLSSTELILYLPKPSPAASEIEVVLYWPAPTHAPLRMAVRVKGRIVRKQANAATVHIDRYDFTVLREPASAPGLTPRPTAKVPVPTAASLAS